jgi:spore coat protein U-like protein
MKYSIGRGGNVGGRVLVMRHARFAAPILFLLPVLAMAGQATGTFRMTLTVVASCGVQTRPLAFAPYTTGGPTTGTAVSGAIDVSCTPGTHAAVYLDGDRTLTGPGGARVAYALQANGQAWSAGKSLNVQGQGAEAVHFAISGSVLAGQKVPLGDYADVAVVRVVY